METLQQKIYVFLAQGIAQESDIYRLGSRHPLLILARAETIEAARQLAIIKSRENGWYPVDILREKPLDYTYVPDDPVKQEALRQAHESGYYMVIYSEEIPPDA